ncbi:DUF262 domain-containing protein [Aureispira anguillae]|uniref:DUF262 domain-containing HNH endonuclease familyprotein n=1 Tax=Aureispira anguillae TaxID=2864201 RepID=A0A915YGV4_9BACT|nr:DUF262 domain-containing HNH endonuclease family protein [Aureispira anguillae]BDS12802.1 DUF262 domain-containing HNH endonuclease familyprotein [Aureispira anguillae]
MHTNPKAFDTTIVSLETVEAYYFYIPTYQRPYVWGEEQLKKLLDNFHLSFKNNPDSIYYISTFLTREEGDQAELIDGQQRFTSLWLISLVLSRLCPESKISSFLKKDDKLRLGFEIREEIRTFLEDLLSQATADHNFKDESYIEEHPYLRNIAKALVFIQNYIKQKISNNELKGFGDYIFQKVQLIKNTTPKHTDLNKLFSTINSAGVQLEQTDIVKANLLKLIDEKVQFGKIWEACENMHNFFERNARRSFPASVTQWEAIDFEQLVPFDKNIFRYKSEANNQESVSNQSAFLIDDLEIEQIPSYTNFDKNNQEEEARTSKEIYCRSIINFGQLLLHTYRIHLKREQLNDFEGTFHVSRLIEIFKGMIDRNNAEEIKRFFYLLWEIRYLFDKYIIKWISDTDTKTETLELVNFNRNTDGYYSRTKYEKSSSLMLQSVLYFTGDYLRQYWLTTYLGYLLDHHNDLKANAEEHLSFLEKIDNVFSLNNSSTDKEISWLLLDNQPIAQDINIETYLNGQHSTRFKHYWFFKLEYILWKNWSFEKNESFKNYKITSRNSVEHIYPQNDNHQKNTLEDEYLHAFGNLVLLSVSQNSEYSNKPVGVKRSMFKAKRETYDTLKSYYIFNSYGDTWNVATIKKHQEEMIAIILDHYKY